MDTHSIDPSGHKPQQPSSLEAVSGAQADAEAADTTSSSELGRVAQDVGTTINKWSDRVTTALDQWLTDANDMEDALSNFTDTAQSVAHQLKAMVQAYKNYPNGTLYFSQSQNQRMLDMMSALGVPPSQIQGGGINSAGQYRYESSQYAADIRIAVQYAAQDLQTFTASMSQYKNSETKDMMAVMFCYNAEKMNMESLTSALESLTSLATSLEQNIS